MRPQRDHARRALASWLALALAFIAGTSSVAQTAPQPAEAATMLSPFGGRANYSPDGQRIVFVGKTYGDAYELDLATGRVRNLTADFPHQGIVRIQYLADGNFLVTAPRVYFGANTRAHLEMWFLHKSLAYGLQPLAASVFEGMAVSRRSNLIAWTAADPAMKPADNWQMAFARPTTRHIASIEVEGHKAKLTGMRTIMTNLPAPCTFIEPQDFRKNDGELVYSCMSMTRDQSLLISIMGTDLKNGEHVTYYRQEGEYNEVEGIAPDGSWAAVECGKQEKSGLPELDICRLELRPGGAMTHIVAGRVAGSTSDISNPVVSPDGKWLIFQRSDSSSPDIGEGFGLFRLRLEN